jgi:DNA (cytosine-5)-methyltransferase 1
VDLFAGVGGLGLGAESAGGELRLSVELDPVACATLSANQPEGSRVLQADVTELAGQRLRREAGIDARDPLVVVGGAPCQPFSKAAYWTESGDDAAYQERGRMVPKA